MKKLSFLLGLLSILALPLSAQSSIQNEVNEHLKNLPFASFSIQVPVFQDKTFNIKDAGAVGDGAFLNTEAINSTIKKCSEAGGGTVLIPAGLWRTGGIVLQSNVNLHLEAGAFVVFSDDINDYDLIGGGFSRLQPLLYGEGLTNVAITGKGVFNGNGDKWRPIKKEKMNEKEWKNLIKTGELSADGKMWYPRKGTIAATELKQNSSSADLKTREANEKIKLTMRPYLFNLEKTENVLVEGVTFQNSPHITNMLRGVNNLVMKDVKVLNNWWAQNADGLDISASRNVLLYNCTVNTGDDGICMKSSGNPAKGEFKLENIVIKDCQVFHGHGGFVIGSNTDGGMNNIYVKNCAFSWTETGLRFKSDVGRGGRVQNVFIEDIFMKDIEKEAILFDLSYADKGAVTTADHQESDAKVPDIDGIVMKNIYCEGAERAIAVRGEAGSIVKNVSITNAVLQAEYGALFNYADGFVLDNVNIVPQSGLSCLLNQTNGFTLKNSAASVSGNYLTLMGTRTQNVLLKNTGIKTENIKQNAQVPQGAVRIE